MPVGLSGNGFEEITKLRGVRLKGPAGRHLIVVPVAVRPTGAFFALRCFSSAAQTHFALPSALAPIDRARRELGYAPEFDVKRGVVEGVRWYLNNEKVHAKKV